MTTIDKRLAVPYYEQLAELLRREITDKRATGELYQLPSENELCERHGLSRATVRHALDELERDGVIYRLKGIGSFAPVRRVEQELTKLVSTTEVMRQRGWELETRLMSVRQTPASPHVARALEIVSDVAVYEVTRLRLIEGTPLTLQTTFLPAMLCPRLEENDLTASLYRLLESRYGLRLWSGKETLRARGATVSEGHRLAIREGAPVMATERITFDSTGVAVEYLEAVWRADRYDFVVTLSRPSS